MTTWTAIVVIVAILAGSEVLKARYRARHGITKDMMGDEKLTNREDPALKREIEELRERLKVLERIATDANSVEGRRSRAIADEIEELRDR